MLFTLENADFIFEIFTDVLLSALTIGFLFVMIYIFIVRD